VLALAAREARRLASVALALFVVGCAASPQRRADEADRAYGTSVFRWLLDHDPSALDVAGIDATATRPFVHTSRVAQAPNVPPAACAQARRDHALLLAFAKPGTPARDAYEDCGYTIERDGAALVIAPR